MQIEREARHRHRRLVRDGRGGSAGVRQGRRPLASLDVSDEAGERVVAAANEEGPGRAVYHHCDVSRRGDVQSAFEAAVGDLGGLDALIHIAGVEGQSGPVESMSEDEWDRVLDINLKGTFLTNQAAFPHLRDGGGRIVNFASAAGLVSVGNLGHYAASKGGVISWSRCLAMEWGRYGITVVAVSPHAQTPMIERSQENWSPEAVARSKATPRRYRSAGEGIQRRTSRLSWCSSCPTRRGTSRLRSSRSTAGSRRFDNAAQPPGLHAERRSSRKVEAVAGQPAYHRHRWTGRRHGRGDRDPEEPRSGGGT